MQRITLDDDVVPPVGIVRVQPEGVVGTDVPGIGRTKSNILARAMEAPLPLPAHDLDLSGIDGNRDELVPDKQPWRQHGRYADRRHYCEPPFQPLVLGLILCSSSLLVTEAEDAIGHEQDDGGKD